MKINLLFFAACREATGQKNAEIELEDDATISDLKIVLSTTYPRLQPNLGALSIAVNSEYMPDETVLSNGDEVALIPPVSGGSGF